jgi:hypothetical protein
MRLETFLPPESLRLGQADEPLFVAGADHRGYNSGVFFIRAHPWSLRFIALCYSDIEGLADDQDSIMFHLAMRDPFTKKLFGNHFQQIPQNWTNFYPDWGKHRITLQTHLVASLKKGANAIKWTDSQIKQAADVYQRAFSESGNKTRSLKDALALLKDNAFARNVTETYYSTARAGTHGLVRYTPPTLPATTNWELRKLQILAMDGWENTELAYKKRYLLTKKDKKKQRQYTKSIS